MLARRLTGLSKYLRLSFFLILAIWSTRSAMAATPEKNDGANPGLLAIVNVRIVPVVGQEIQSGTILVENGK